MSVRIGLCLYRSLCLLCLISFGFSVSLYRLSVFVSPCLSLCVGLCLCISIYICLYIFVYLCVYLCLFIFFYISLSSCLILFYFLISLLVLFHFLSVTTPPPPPPPQFLLLSFSSLHPLSSFFSSSFSLPFSGPTVFSFSPLPSSSGASAVFFLGLFLLYHRFLPFLLFSFSCLFLRLPFLLLFFFFGFSFPFGFSLFFFRFPIACFSVLGLFGLVFQFFLLLSFLSLSLLISLFFHSVIRFLVLSSSLFLSPLQFLFVYFFFSPPFLCPSAVRLSSARGLLSPVLPSTPSFPIPFLRLQPLRS